MKLSIQKGATSVRVRVFIQDSSSTTGAGLTGLAYNTAGLTCYRMRDDDGNADATAISLVAMTRGTWTSGGFVEKDSTNAPGWYEFSIPNAALATGSRSVGIHFKGAANMAPLPLEIELTGWDNQVVPGQVGGMLVVGSNVGAVTFGAGVVINNSTLNGSALAITGNGTGEGILSVGGSGGGAGAKFVGAGGGSGVAAWGGGTNSHGIDAIGTGTGSGAKFTPGSTGPGVKIAGGATSGAGIEVTTTSGDGLLITPTAGNGLVLTANGASKHGLVATGGTSGTSDGIKGVAGSGGVDIRGNITGNITGNLSGSAGSVTGNVGGSVASVSGNVGGSVASVVGLTASNLDTTISSRASATDLATVAGYVDTEIAAIKVQTDLIPSSPAAVGDIPTANEIADQVWDEILSGHAAVGSTGAALSAAGGSGDPWATALPGVYGSGTAGQIVGDFLDQAVSSVSGLDAAGVRAAIGLASANLDTQLGDVPSANENADALLGRNVSGGSSSGRTVKQAFHFIRNKWVVSGGTLTVFDTDDTTTSWTGAVTGTPGADPITGMDAS